MLWEFLTWAGPPVALGIISNILTPYARRALRKYSDKTRTLFAQLGSKISTSFSKLSTSLSQISFLAAAKRKLITFAQLAVVGVAKIAVFCFWVFMIYLQVNRMTERSNTVRANSAATTISTSCDCPTPTSSLYRPRLVSTHDCSQQFGISPQYPAQSASYAGVRTPVSDCSPPRKGKKARGVQRPCADVNPFPAIGTGRARASGYSIDDEPL